MMGRHACAQLILCALAAVVSGVLTLGILGGKATAEDTQGEKTHQVKPKEKSVEKNAKIDHDKWWPPWQNYEIEEVAPQDVTSDDTGKVTIVTKTFTPPENWNFTPFTRDETPAHVRARLQSDINPGAYVDIVLDPDGLIFDETTVTVLPDGEQAIKITVAKLTIPETAAEFPLKCEGNLQPPAGEGDQAWHWSAKMGIKALVASCLGCGSQIDQIVASTESLGYTVTEDNSLGKAEAIEYAPKHIVWYSLSHGKSEENGMWTGLLLGDGGVLGPSDLPGGLKYTFVFLCACRSASPSGSRMANAFGAKAYVGWKGPMNKAAAVQFSVYLFEEFDGRTSVNHAVSKAFGRFTPGSVGWRFVNDNINVVRGGSVVVDLRPA